MQWKISVEVDEYIFLTWPVECVPDLHPSLFISSLYGFGSCLNNHFGKRIPFADSLMSARRLGCCAHPQWHQPWLGHFGCESSMAVRYVCAGSPSLPAAKPFLQVWFHCYLHRGSELTARLGVPTRAAVAPLDCSVHTGAGRGTQHQQMHMWTTAVSTKVRALQRELALSPSACTEDIL